MGDIPKGLTAAFFTIDNNMIAAGFYDAVTEGPLVQIKRPYFTPEMAEQIVREFAYEKQIAGYTVTDESITIEYRAYREEKTDTYHFVTIDGHRLIRLCDGPWAWVITNL